MRTKAASSVPRARAIAGTYVVVLAWDFLPGQTKKRNGLLGFATGLSLGGTTGYAINPARDLGPRLAHALLPIFGKRDSDWGSA